jgi:hypothetical protein
MIEWLKSLPKTIFVALVLGVGVLFIVFSDPPRTICDARMKAFDEGAKGFLTVDPVKKREARFGKLLDICKKTNSVGGCYELFQNLRETVKATRLVGADCYSKLASRGEVKNAIQQSLDFMVRSAWGAEPPTTPALKAGWLDASDINLFCQLKTLMMDLYGENSWNGFIEGYFKELPKAQSLERTDAWQKMLFSVNCASYL